MGQRTRDDADLLPSRRDDDRSSPYLRFFRFARRLLKTRENLVEVLQGHILEDQGGEAQFLQMPEIPELRVDVGGESSTSGPMLYVRDDGTVDWEGALQDRAALRKFGSAVWARINGQTPDELDEEEARDDNASQRAAGATAGTEHQSKPAVTAKIEETAAIKEAREELNRLSSELKDMEKAHTALLASGE